MCRGYVAEQNRKRAIFFFFFFTIFTYYTWLLDLTCFGDRVAQQAHKFVISLAPNLYFNISYASICLQQ